MGASDKNTAEQKRRGSEGLMYWTKRNGCESRSVISDLLE